MKIALLLYNTVFTCILTLAAVCAFYLYRRQRHTVFPCVFAVFALYLADSFLIFCTEMVEEFSAVYDQMFISTASYNTVYYVCLMGCLTAAFYLILKPGPPVPFYLAMGIYAALLVCMPMVPDIRWRVFLYFLPTQLMLICLSVTGILTLHKHPERYQRRHFYTFHMALIYVLCLAVFILLEDTLVIFHYDHYTTGELTIASRSYTENLLMLGIAFFFIRHTVETLDQLDSSPEVPADPASSEVPAAQRNPVAAFGLAHNLTERECEILSLLLSGKSQQEICDEMLIALGTVKTHIHNVYSKMDVTKRTQLMAKYQEFCEKSNSEP